jgi:hypothetical protein
MYIYTKKNMYIVLIKTSIYIYYTNINSRLVIRIYACYINTKLELIRVQIVEYTKICT